MIILSNGGHLPISHGFYMKEVPVGFQFGLTKNDNSWKVNFGLEYKVWSHIAATLWVLKIQSVSKEFQA